MHSRVRNWLLAAVLTAVAAAPAPAQPLDYWQLLALDRASFRVPGVALLPADDSPGVTLVYGDRFGFLRVVRVTSTDTRELWRSRPLDSPILEVFCEDLDGRGGTEIVARTQRRVFVFDERYNQRWESPEADYQIIQAMAIGNVDSDSPYELVLLADSSLYYIDGGNFSQEYRSSQSYGSKQMAIGNVDSDFSLEIVLNEGYVFDVERESTEWQTEIFGEFIELVDIDGDGIQEILGFSQNQPMRIFEGDDQQEKPFQ